MNWVEIGKNRERLPKDGDSVVLAYLDPSNGLKYAFAMRNESCYYHGRPALIHCDTGAIIDGTYIAYAGPLPRFSYNPMYDFAVKLFDFSEESEASS